MNKEYKCEYCNKYYKSYKSKWIHIEKFHKELKNKNNFLFYNKDYFK